MRVEFVVDDFNMCITLGLESWIASCEYEDNSYCANSVDLSSLGEYPDQEQLEFLVTMKKQAVKVDDTITLTIQTPWNKGSITISLKKE